MDELLIYDRTILVNILIYHYRKDDSSCGCGWGILGASHAEHVADIYEESIRAVVNDSDVIEEGGSIMDTLLCGLDLADGNNTVPATTIVEGWALCSDCANIVVYRNFRYPDGHLVVLLPKDVNL